MLMSQSPQILCKNVLFQKFALSWVLFKQGKTGELCSPIPIQSVEMLVACAYVCFTPVYIFRYLKAKVSFLQMELEQFQMWLQAGQEVENRPAQRDLGGLVGADLSEIWQCALSAWKPSSILGCIRRSVTSRCREVIPNSATLSWEPCLQSGAPNIGRC